MPESASSILARFERSIGTYGVPGAAAKKLELAGLLAQRSFGTPEELQRFHEALCFLRAYPDDSRVYRRVREILEAFRARPDLRRFRAGLLNSGISGTEIAFRFYWPTAQWLARRWPQGIEVDWPEFLNRERVPDLLPLMLPYCETLGMDEVACSAQEWTGILKAPEESDAYFLIRRFESLRTDTFGRERLYDTLDPPLRLSPAADLPGRGEEVCREAPVSFQATPLDRSRPDLREAAEVPPMSVEVVERRSARRLIDLARIAMINRSRDLDAFAFANPDDVRLIDCGDGLAFACYGLLPERRLMLESSYGLLTLKNGVPIGYVLISALFGSAAIAYNVFDTFRGGEAAQTYGRVLAVARHLFGVDTFSVDPFQLGHDNQEGLRSGAWWFYYKLGFRPVDPGVRRVVRAELGRMRRDPTHRSTLTTLRKLVVDDLYFYLEGPRRDVLGRVSLGEIGLEISRYLARRFGADRERGIRTCVQEARERLGVGPEVGERGAGRLAWERWSPLIACLEGLDRWTPGERRAAAEVIEAKGGRHESDFVPRFDAHRKLRDGVLRLAGAL